MKGLPHFKYDMPSEPAPANIVLQVKYKLKDSVNELAKLDHMTLSLHFHFNLSCECEDCPQIGHL